MRFEDVARIRARVWKQPVVVAEDEHVVASGATKRAFPIFRHAHLLDGFKKPNTRIVKFRHRRTRSGVIPALVHDHFKIVISLCEHRPQAMAQRVRPSARWYHNREHHDGLLAIHSRYALRDRSSEARDIGDLEGLGQVPSAARISRRESNLPRKKRGSHATDDPPRPPACEQETTTQQPNPSLDTTLQVTSGGPLD